MENKEAINILETILKHKRNFIEYWEDIIPDLPTSIKKDVEKTKEEAKAYEMAIKSLEESSSRRMTNFEKIIENDKERLIEGIAEKLCINTDKFKINIVEPFLCGDCFFGRDGKCNKLELKEWLESEVEE